MWSENLILNNDPNFIQYVKRGRRKIRETILKRTIANKTLKGFNKT
jgi:hypothetical protein